MSFAPTLTNWRHVPVSAIRWRTPGFVFTIRRVVTNVLEVWRAARCEAISRRALAGLSPELRADIGITEDRRWEAEKSLACHIRYL